MASEADTRANYIDPALRAAHWQPTNIIREHYFTDGRKMADDVRKVLSGLATVVEGIGALRTHGGDAHGRERGYTRLDTRIASLAIHSASTAALFLIETWQMRYPSTTLVRH
tara:strand:- start:1142 stop:1477 length:336 start_codon:yes stop_codon:yes gene_type:complete